ncbi:MAG: UMP kinase [Clostridia bacterium]|nr:UMP kinase [Clostridia bacterium]
MNFKRVILKLSGESLANSNGFGINSENCHKVANMIKSLFDAKIQIGLVIGAGNFWRGRTGTQISRVKSDKMGILATAMNALAFSDILNNIGIKTLIQSSIEIKSIIPAFSVDDTVNALENNKIVIFSCGIGSPFFSTDTIAALRAAEINADIILKATTVDGVYSGDPKINKNSVKYDKITFDEVLSKNLKVMDMTAISLCKEAKISILVFKFEDISKIISENKIGTYIY